MTAHLDCSLDPLHKFSTLVDLLRYRAVHQPSQLAFTFLRDGEIEADSLTYQELDRQAAAIAAQLQSYGVSGERSLLLYPPGLEFIAAFFGCLYAQVVAVPIYPPRRNQKLSRIQAIAADAQTKVALTTESVLADIDLRWAENPELSQLNWIATNSIDPAQETSWVSLAVTEETLAFLQYTSGSTGTPKGVMVSHGNLLRNSADLDLGWEHTSDSVVVTWLPTFHDMGLIYGMLQPLYKGCSCYMMAPISFLQKPIRWLQAISRYRGTHSGAPNFAYELCVRKTTPEQRAQLDLSSWRMALNGAEPVRVDVLEKFAEAFKLSGFDSRAFCPGYGLAEATLKVSAVRAKDMPVYCHVRSDALEQHRIVEVSADHPGGQTLIGCGWTEIDTKIVIVNPQTCTKCASDEVGEIWVSGSTIPQGYWQRPEATKETFQAYLADSAEGPFLRTGDLGFVRHGELYVTGRIKDVLIVRGRNHYPQDIELTVEKSHPAFRASCGAAFSVEVEGEERLVIAQEVERSYLHKLDVDEVVRVIRRAVSEQHELQVYGVVLLKTGSIPKTSSGKIQRHACRVGFLEKHLSVVGEWKLGIEETAASPTGSEPLGQEINLHNSPNGAIRRSQDSIKTSITAHSANRDATSRTLADNLIGWLRSYANERINSRLIDERRCIPPYIVLDFGNRGLLGMQVPEQYGGIALSYRDTFRVFEQLAAIDLTLASFVAVHHVLGTRPILKYASQSVRDELLPLLAQGRELAGFAITEPGAGSNPRGIATQAIPHSSGGWRLQGQKMWIGHGSWAGVINVFAQTLDANHQPVGISSFVVRQGTKGLCQGPEALTMGMRGMVQNSIYLNDVPVGSENLLGAASSGMEVAQDAMMHGRLLIGVMSLGGMKRCAQLMLRYSSRRSISTGRLLDNPITLVWLSDLTAAITALETLIFRIAELLDQGRLVPQEAFTACKTAGPELIWQAADRLVQLLGGRGYIETNIASQILRDARLFRIFEGPTETLNMFLGSRAINQSAELHRFLCEDLGAPEVAQSLKAAAAQIKARLTSSQLSFFESQSALRWAYIRTGEVVTLAILLAAVRSAFDRSRAASLQRAVTWAKLQFEQKLASVLSGTPGELVLSDAEAVTAQISDYTAAIGDLEQTLAGEDHSLDELLQRQTSAVSVQSKPNLTEAVPEQRENGHRQPAESSNPTVDTIQDWSENWLAKKLRIATGSVNPDTSFADYGIDSVMAVELAQDLGDWLKHPIEATILWNFPTIKSLAQHLAGKTKIAEPSESVKVREKVPFGFNEASENPVEGSIAQELAKLENLLGK